MLSSNSGFFYGRTITLGLATVNTYATFSGVAVPELIYRLSLGCGTSASVSLNTLVRASSSGSYNAFIVGVVALSCITDRANLGCKASAFAIVVLVSNMLFSR